MNACKSLLLFGSLEARSLAKGLLENHPGIRRVDAQSGNAYLKLFMSDELSQLEILGLIKESGLSGVSFE